MLKDLHTSYVLVQQYTKEKYFIDVFKSSYIICSRSTNMKTTIINGRLIIFIHHMFSFNNIIKYNCTALLIIFIHHMFSFNDYILCHYSNYMRSSYIICSRSTNKNLNPTLIYNLSSYIICSRSTNIIDHFQF